MFVNRTWNVPTVPAIQEPVELSHIDTDLCWCEPIVEMDEDGKEVVIHREVTWN